MNPPITFVSHTNKPGGAELALRRYLERTSLHTRLVTLQEGGVWEGLPTDVVPVRGLYALRRALRSGGLVVGNSMRATFLSALVAPRDGRLVYWVRDGLADSAMSPFALALTRHVTARRVWRYIANSRWTAGTIVEALGVRPEDVDVRYSPSGVSAGSLAAPHAEPHQPLRLLYLGRLAAWKAPHIAVQALEHLQEVGVDARLTIAGGAHFGEEAYAWELESLARVTGNVEMVGHVADVGPLLQTHDVVVHCSVRPEPFGQVVVQGLAAGLPVVVSAGGGPQEILRGSPVSLAYQPGDPLALAVAVHQALGAYAELSQWGLGRVTEFVDEKICDTLDDLLTRLS